MYSLPILVQQILGHMNQRRCLVRNSYTYESLIEDVNIWHLLLNGVGDKTVKYDRVYINCVLPGH